jgi:hypothetical protein
MTEEKEIEEILMEASAYGVRADIMQLASYYYNERMEKRKVDAYQRAYRELITLKPH